MKHFSDCSKTKDMPVSCTIKSDQVMHFLPPGVAYTSAKRYRKAKLQVMTCVFVVVLLGSYLRPLQAFCLNARSINLFF